MTSSRIDDHFVGVVCGEDAIKIPMSAGAVRSVWMRRKGYYTHGYMNTVVLNTEHMSFMNNLQSSSALTKGSDLVILHAVHFFG